MKSIKDFGAKVKAWDEKHTNFHSATYMLVFLAAAAETGMFIQQAAAMV